LVWAAAQPVRALEPPLGVGGLREKNFYTISQYYIICHNMIDKNKKQKIIVLSSVYCSILIS